MRIGFKQLEKLRRNPKSINDKNAFFGGRSKFIRWQDAVSRYHSKGNNINEAQKFLEATFARLADNSLNKRDLKKYSEHLLEYDHDYKKLDSEQIAYRMSFNLDTEFDHNIAGQISRVDINTSDAGYSVYSFEKEISDWESELRFPLIQKVVADYFGCSAQEVNVGIYHLINGTHLNTSFSDAEIRVAIDEMNNVFKEVNKVLKK